MSSEDRDLVKSYVFMWRLLRWQCIVFLQFLLYLTTL